MYTYLYSFLSKCQQYSPSETGKAYEKAVTRKLGLLFEPVLVLSEVQSDALGKRVSKSKEECLKQYLEVHVYVN